MDPERARVHADLRGLLHCEVLCDDLSLQMYASDASVYELRPLGVVRPRTTDEVAICLRYASENAIPVHARGAGSGLAGESLGPGLVLDFAHSMRRLLEVGEDFVRVQPGLVLAQLNRLLAPGGRLFGPDPSTRSVTTMGSVVAVDASGSHWPKYGSARRHVLRLQVVLSDGSVLEVDRRCPLTNDADSRRQDLSLRLGELLRRENDLIRAHQPRSVINRAGYHVGDVVHDDHVDLAGLLVGSEGTLALVTEATLATCPVPRHRGLTLLFFDRLEAAARGALEVAPLGVATCDLMDRRLLNIARETDSRFAKLIPRDAEALLFIEQQGEDPAEVRQQLENLAIRLRRRQRLAFDSRTTMEREERNLYWRLARRVVPMLHRLRGSTRPLPFVEDIAVPPAVLPDFLVTLQNVLKAHQVTASLFAHAGHGQLHVRPFLDLASADDIRKMDALATDLYEQVLAVGGTISGEHGLGLSRTWYLRRQYGPLYDVFREVKRIWDPQGILNPGKVVAETPQPLTKNLRHVSLPSLETTPAARPLPALQLAWTAEEAATVARTCNGCARCRTTAPDERMCPMYRVLPEEEAAPRAKANLLRAVLTRQLDPKQMGTDQWKATSELCFHCHQCRLECPAGVDIPWLVTEAKAQHAAVNGLRFPDWLMSRIDAVAALASRFPGLANWVLRNRQMRWLLESTTGIAQGRRLPRLAAKSFLRRAQRRRLNRPVRSGRDKVLYFVDVFANYFDPELAEALVAVFEHNGISVHVPTNQLAAGMPAIVIGAIDRAHRLARRNISILADAVRQGYKIITTEPAALMCLRHEYLHLVSDDEARMVAENTCDAGQFLWELHQHGRLELDMRPVNVAVGYHLPCHLRAFHEVSPGEELLRLVPGVSVQRLEEGCSGMAGTWGLRRKNLRTSLRIGWGLITKLRGDEVTAGVTECATCNLQMQQGSSKPVLHPLKILAMAYGILPETPDRWTKRRNLDHLIP